MYKIRLKRNFNASKILHERYSLPWENEKQDFCFIVLLKENIQKTNNYKGINSVNKYFWMLNVLILYHWVKYNFSKIAFKPWLLFLFYTNY